MDEFHRGQTPEEHAVRMQRALRRPGRARRVDEQGAVFRRGVHRLKIVGFALKQLAIVEHAVGIRAIDADDVLQLRQVLLRRKQALETVRIGDRHLHAGIAEPVLQGLGPE